MTNSYYWNFIDTVDEADLVFSPLLSVAMAENVWSPSEVTPRRPPVDVAALKVEVVSVHQLPLSVELEASENTTLITIPSGSATVASIVISVLEVLVAGTPEIVIDGRWLKRPVKSLTDPTFNITGSEVA